MAVSKLWPVTVRLATVLDYASNPEKTTKSKSKYSDADYQALRDVVAYAKDGEKTERELFCEGIHCNPQTAREQFITVKEQFDKPDGIQAYHGYLSFEETDITPELAQQVGMAFAERMWGRPVSSPCDNASEYGASSLPLRCELRFVQGRQAIAEQRESVVVLPPYCR